ncbi:hypothetical protein ACFFSY_14245 [Paenibacillus aurantiacus]|uniref:DUF4440 domain-containing protein n=1 Tax=Paenibacillus aurantiacus TaxID=1936118 RepID=A0ABV5KR64_9BACL
MFWRGMISVLVLSFSLDAHAYGDTQLAPKHIDKASIMKEVKYPNDERNQEIYSIVKELVDAYVSNDITKFSKKFTEKEAVDDYWRYLEEISDGVTFTDAEFTFNKEGTFATAYANCKNSKGEEYRTFMLWIRKQSNGEWVIQALD